MDQVGGTAVRLKGHEEKWVSFVCREGCVLEAFIFPCNPPDTAYVDWIHGSSLPGYIQVFINHKSDCATVLPWSFSRGFQSLQESIRIPYPLPSAKPSEIVSMLSSSLSPSWGE